MTVDVYGIEGIFEELSGKNEDDAKRRGLYDQLMKLYVGDLLQSSEQYEWALARATA